MQTALHSWSFRDRFAADPDFTVFDALEQTAAMGFTGIEIMAGQAGGARPGDFASDDLPYLKRVARHAETRGVRILSLSTYNDFAFVKNEAWRQANVAYIRKWLRIAGEMDVPNIRMLTGYYVEGESRERLEDLVRDGIRACVPDAEEAGVNMALENHNTLFFTADEILALMDEIGSPRLTACPDPTNWASATFFLPDTPPEEQETVYRQAALLAPKATQSHLKIKGIAADGVLIGYGGAGLERLLRIYRDAGYGGALAFESIVESDDGDDLLSPLPEVRRIVDEAIARVLSEPKMNPAAGV